jgi:lysophospholipase L1-like esterase
LYKQNLINSIVAYIRSMRMLCLIFLLTGIALSQSYGQQQKDPARFKKEVDSIVALNRAVNKANLILFTGSSSIRMWSSLKSDFPKYNVVNMGFGGSEMADLAYYVNDIVVPLKPKKIFIYEGDNDISFGRNINEILSSADSVLLIVRESLPDAKVIFISAKPSLSRWKLKEQYEVFNNALKDWTATKKGVRFADVWTPMLDKSGSVKKDIFIEDGLHLNKKGYAIWTATLRKYLR